MLIRHEAEFVFMGDEVAANDYLRLNKGELATMRRAAVIAERARDLIEERYGLEVIEGSPLVSVLSELEAGCNYLADSGEQGTRLHYGD